MDLEQFKHGDIRQIKRFQGYRSRKCIWIVCKNCNKGFWLDFYYYKRKYKSGLCVSCYRKGWDGKKNPCWKGGDHIDGDRKNNKINNLELLKSQIHHLSSMGVQGYIKKLENEIILLKSKISTLEEYHGS